MKKVIACNARYGAGGLGQHLASLVEQARTQETLAYYLTPGIKTGDEQGIVLEESWARRLLPYPPLRYSPGWSNFISADWFDRKVASQMPHLPKAEVLEAFGGHALHSFRAARQQGFRSLELQAANSHVLNVQRQHQKAIRRFGIESSWLNPTQCQKTCQEYALADVIHVASGYTRTSFIEAGIPAEKLQYYSLKPAPRFVPPATPPSRETFRMIYVGSLTVMKGIPVLLEAFAKLPIPKAELVLVGGWATRGMREYLKPWLQRDPRIKLAPGDPLPHLQSSHVYVHPTFEDGFAYAPMEALACGLPVIVTEDTGMKDHVQEGINGYIVPTGDVDALVERLIMIWKHPLVGIWVNT